MADFKNSKSKHNLGSKIRGFGGLFKGFKQVKPSNEMTPTQDAFYEEAYNYIQKELPSKLTKISAETQDAINTGQNFALGSNKVEKQYHDTLLKAVNLRGLHDLTLSSPDMDESLLRNIRVQEDGIDYGMSDLTVIVQRSPGGNSSLGMAANPVSPTAIVNGGYKLARLQIIPLTDNIYMSLAKNGGFYIREQEYLVPIRMESVESYIKTLKKFNSPTYLKDSVKNIHNFNRFVYETTAKLKGTAESPEDVLSSISISTTTPTSVITYGSNAAGSSTQNTYNAPPPNTPPPNSSARSTYVPPSGQSQGTPPPSGAAQSNDSDFKNESITNQLSLIAGFGRTTTVPFSGVTHDNPSWRDMYDSVRNALPENLKRSFYPSTFDTALLIGALSTKRSPRDMLLPFSANTTRELLTKIANMPLYEKTSYLRDTAINFLGSRGIRTDGSLIGIHNAFIQNPEIFSRWKEYISDTSAVLQNFTPPPPDFRGGA